MTNNSNIQKMDHGIIEVRGAAGSGKTFQLISDINSLYHDNKKIAVISFSNAAINELQSRLGKSDTTLSTIHSFCWKIIRPVANRIFDYAKRDSGFLPDAFMNKDYDLSDIRNIKYGELGIPNFTQSSGELWLSHNDVISLFNFALANIESFSKMIEGAFDYILIDEYQDTDGLFLQNLFKYLSNKIVIGIYGDPLQTIYLNNNSINVTSIKKTYPVNELKLNNNYRSQSSLVSFFNKVRLPYDGIQQIAQLNSKDDIFVFSGDKELSPEDITKIQRKANFDEFIVLSLTNKLRTKIVGYNSIVTKLKKCIPTRKISWPEILNPEQLNGYIQALLQYSNIFGENNYDSIRGLLKVFDQDSISQISLDSIHDSITQQKSLKTASLSYFDKLGLQLNPEFNKISKFIDSFSLDELKQTNSFYRSLQDINNKSKTIFASKGLEFPNVILNIDNGKYPFRDWNKINFSHSESDPMNIESDIMSYLFYVGISRAEKGLAIYVNTSRQETFLLNLKSKFPNLQYISI